MRLVYWLPTFLWMVLIFAFSSQPALGVSTISTQDLFLRKTAHFTEYFLLTYLYYFSLSKTTSFSRRQILLASLVFSLLYAVSDELHQTMVPGREGKFRDVFLDSWGILWAQISLRLTKPSN